MKTQCFLVAFGLLFCMVGCSRKEVTPRQHGVSLLPMANATSVSVRDLDGRNSISIDSRKELATLLSFFAGGKPITKHTDVMGTANYGVKFTMPNGKALDVGVSWSWWEVADMQGRMKPGAKKYFSSLFEDGARK